MSDVFGIGAGVGAIMNYLGARDTSDANQAINKKNIAWQAQSLVQQQQWQEHMRETAYQATMKDMKAAGLNPMLAFSKGPTPYGGASAAPGSSLGAVAPDLAGGIERGVNAVVSARNAGPARENLLAQNDSIRANADAQRAAANRSNAEADLATAQIAGARGVPAVQGSQIESNIASAAQARSQAQLLEAERNLREQQFGIIQRSGPAGPISHPQVAGELASRAQAAVGRSAASAAETRRNLDAPGPAMGNVRQRSRRQPIYPRED